MDLIPAVKLEVHHSQSQIQLLFSATVVSFPLLSPQDIGIHPESIGRLIRGEVPILSSQDFGRHSVLVMPRLSVAELVSVTRKPPVGSCFGDWKSMKKYWLDVYGYNFEDEEDEENDEPEVYYNVAFANGPTMTYPEWTVRKSKPKPVGGADPKMMVEELRHQLESRTSPLLFGEFFTQSRKENEDFISPCASPSSQTEDGGKRRNPTRTVCRDRTPTDDDR